MLNTYLALKALHIVAVISWMAGLLYLYRLLVYHRGEANAAIRERFLVMESRLLRIIATPAALVSLLSGGMLVLIRGCQFWLPSWLALKLLAVMGILVIHLLAAVFLKRLTNGQSTLSEKAFRWMNEIPTILMIIIVVLVVFQPQWGFLFRCHP